MHSQAISPFDSDGIRAGVCTAVGWGLRIHVHGRHLVVEDGIGRSRRTRRFHKATSGLKRLVIIGHSGFITFEASRWLADAKVQVIHLDDDGRILTVSAQAPNLPKLRRAQAQAMGNPTGVEVTRYLLKEKVSAQFEVATSLGGELDEIEQAIDLLEGADDIEQLAIAERQAAVTYWRAWRDVPVQFVRADVDKMPEHWITFGQRRSTQSASGRRAINPINAILNYLYALLEAEARVAAIAVGLDPGLGILHQDTKSRDSFALDLMEAARPAVDRYVFDLLEGHVFRASDFIETRSGVCRVARKLAHQLSTTATQWADHLAKPAEDVAKILVDSDSTLPTALTQSNRRQSKNSPWRVARTDPKLESRYCTRCGDVTAEEKKLCNDCWEQFQADATWLAAGRERLAALRAEGVDPAHGGAARTKRASKISAENRASAEWSRKNPDRPSDEQFTSEMLPGLQEVPLREMSQATGLSIDYCSKIRRGLNVPHPRHWPAFKKLAVEPESAS